jgi:uncharacterized protein (DUF362 family)
VKSSQPANQRNFDKSKRFGRRQFIQGTAGALAVAVGGKLIWDCRNIFEVADVFIASVPSYSSPLEDYIRTGLQELGIGRDFVKGKTVLLKPNLVEPSIAAPHINTHPNVVCAAAEAFRSWDAKEVFVAEGQGHCRDTDWVLEQSGLGPKLDQARIPFVDLNVDDVFAIKNKLCKTSLHELWLPQTIRKADLIVSMPKMKTHHWIGVTLSMKNMFGVMPGICYGWPKNLLHMAGISESILDIVASVRPHLAIVDGIIGMEGDGPIMGNPRQSGVIVMGENFPAVDATCSRLMGIEPKSISYLAGASGLLGQIHEFLIRQHGEQLAALVQHYRLPPGNVLTE